MKSLIIYYSFSGNTEKVAKSLATTLSGKGEVSIKRLQPKDEITSFFAQCKAAFKGHRASIDNLGATNVSTYDLIAIGSPVWAFAPTPALNTYLDAVNGLHGKKVVVFLTSGSGAGVKRCFSSIRRVLENKGASSIIEVNIPNRNMGDAEFVKSSFASVA